MKMHKEAVFLLSLTPYRGSDLIVTLLSPKFGRLAGLIYGGKKIGNKSSFPYHPGDYIEIEFQIQERNEFVKIYSVNAVRLVDVETLVYDRFLFHCYFLEVAKLISQPKSPETELTDLIGFYLKQRWDRETKYNLMTAILWRLIVIGGYAIRFGMCSVCRRETLRVGEDKTAVLRKQSYSLLPDAGEIVCLRCLPSPNRETVLSSSMIKVLWLANGSLSADLLSRPIPENVVKPTIKLLSRYMLRSFDIKPKSAAMFVASL